MEKKTLFYILTAIAIAGFIFVAVTNKPKNSPVIALKNNVNKVVSILNKTDKKIIKEEARTSIDVTYPEF